MSPDTTDLKIAVQESEAWSRRLSVTVPAERVQRTRGAVTQQFAQSARLPGFRKGKLPTSLIERQFGASIDQETVDRTIQQAYREALESQGLTPINQGKVDKVQYQKGEDLSFEVELEVRPEIELGRVSGFTVERPAVEVGDEDVEAVLERLRDERAEWAPLEEGKRPDYTDQVTVEITALDEAGETQEGEEPRTYRFVIGEGQAIPEVEEAILTLAPGEEGEFTVRFPEDFPDEERRGEAQRLHIKLVDGRRKILPELDEEFAKSIGEFESLEALRARVLEDLRADAEQRAEAELRQQLVDQVIEANQFPVPTSMVERYLDHMTGHSHEGEHQHQHTPEEEERLAKVRESLRPQAEWSLKRMLIIESVAEKEGLHATQDEIDHKVEELAAKHDRSPSEVWLQLEKSGQLEMLERDITEDKVFQYLLSQNTVA